MQSLNHTRLYDGSGSQHLALPHLRLDFDLGRNLEDLSGKMSTPVLILTLP